MALFHRFLISFVALLLIQVELSAQPSGIYILDNSLGTYRDANIRNYSFVDGFVWRTSWAEIETSQDVYDFAGLDHIVSRLDTIGKKLTVLFGAYSVEPAYIAAHTGVAIYPFTDPISAVTTDRAVPYDAYLMQRYRLFMVALANHPVYSMASDTMVPLKSHPVLANIATNIPGLGAIRNVNGVNTSVQTSLPGYNRAKFVDSITTSMKIQTDNFATKNVFIPFYNNIKDNTASPALVTVIRTRLLTSFDNIQNPKISFWQENLAAYKDTTTGIVTGLPTTTFATPLYGLNDSAYCMFQMLQGWTTPFLDPAKTANTTPFDAMCYANSTYKASYFEVYLSDLEHTDYQPSFEAWDTATACSSTSAISMPAAGNKINIYPNPAQNVVTIKGLQKGDVGVISIFDMLGRNVLISKVERALDITSLSDGIYVVCIKQNQRQDVVKLVIQH